MPVVTLVHADAPPLLRNYWHPITRTATLAQCGHSRAVRIDGESGTSGGELLDHVPAKSEDCGGAGAVRTVNQELFARFWPRSRALPGASGLPRTLKRRRGTIVIVFSASVWDLAVMRGALDADDVDTGERVPGRGPDALKKAGVGPVHALVAGCSPAGRAGCGPAKMPLLAVPSRALGERALRAAGVWKATSVLPDSAPVSTAVRSPTLPAPRPNPSGRTARE
ncbi:hypothetical protein [Streptomyces sp. NPDC059262]|uniref:hypothetical protein n=1 Tax=Streptomyces sp. NPDC059262 TaxID=3346797 RepID=UPI00368CC497